jgi:F0F1-type ATP synthase alpha subunit
MRSEVLANQRKKERVMQLNPAEISELIKSRIEGLAASSDIRNQGTVVSVSDGIVRVHGLSDVMQGEMLEFPATKDGSLLRSGSEPRARLRRRRDSG